MRERFRSGKTVSLQEAIAAAGLAEREAVVVNMRLSGLSFAEIESSIVSSTVPQLSEQWALMSERYLGQRMLVVSPAIRFEKRSRSFR